MTLDDRLRRHFGAVRTAADFDAAVRARIAAVAAADQRFAQARAALNRERREQLLLVAAATVLLIIVMVVIMPGIAGLFAAVAGSMARPVLPGLDLGMLLVLLPFLVWFAVRAPRSA